MKLLLSFLISIFPAIANSSPVPAPEAAPVCSTAYSCPTVTALDFTFKNVSEINYCVSVTRTAARVSIFHNGVCVQQIGTDKARKWAVLTDANGQLHFTDESAHSIAIDGDLSGTPEDSYTNTPIVITAKAGNNNSFNLVSESGNNANELYHFNIFNPSLDAKNFIILEFVNYPRNDGSGLADIGFEVNYSSPSSSMTMCTPNEITNHVCFEFYH